MTTHAAEFCTLDEVNRLKIIQDIVDRHLITQMAAHRLGITDELSADVFRRIIRMRKTMNVLKRSQTRHCLL